MATELVISFRDNRALGTVAEIKALIKAQFPGVYFYWTTSGPEKLQIAKKQGIQFPPELQKILETAPSLLEGVCEGPDWRIAFGLGHIDPLTELIVEPRSVAPEIDRGLAAIERALGTKLRIHGEPAFD